MACFQRPNRRSITARVKLRIFRSKSLLSAGTVPDTRTRIISMRAYVNAMTSLGETGIGVKRPISGMTGVLKFCLFPWSESFSILRRPYSRA